MEIGEEKVHMSDTMLVDWDSLECRDTVCVRCENKAVGCQWSEDEDDDSEDDDNSEDDDDNSDY